MTQPSTQGSRIGIKALDKSFGNRPVLKQLNLTLQAGEFVALVGRSGCGKSTLLRLIAGLDQPSGGSLHVDETERRGLSEDTRVMFQDPRLLPWRRVIDNVALGLPSEKRQRARDALQQVGLADRENDWPAQLSGGQRQRVALARALVHQPRLLLLDEPLGALDALTRLEMQNLIERLWLQQGFTALLVTHDVQEAIALADRIILIENGRVTLDERVDLSRPRQRTQDGFTQLEARVLHRVLQAEQDVVAQASPALMAASPVLGLST